MLIIGGLPDSDKSNYAEHPGRLGCLWIETDDFDLTTDALDAVIRPRR